MTPTTVLPIHPDDVLFFNEVADVMRRVAKQHHLPLKAIEAYPMPTTSVADRLGECHADGSIRLVMRATVNGEFVDAPRSPEAVWQTAAHELAHLRHFNHGKDFQEFELEMRQAVSAQRVDHRQKVIDRLVKMQACRDGEAKLGNVAAAESFAEAINKMLIEHELRPSDIDYARATDDDPVIELRVDLDRFKIDKKKTRVAWQEELAAIVARGHLCKILIRSGSNQVWFVGTKSHVTVAEYVYGTLVPAARGMCTEAYHAYGYEDVATNGRWKAREPGFCESWLTSFVERIAERLREARAAAVKKAAVDVPGGESTALVRLDGALAKVQRYVDDKFKGRSGLGSIGGRNTGNADGHARGRAAANAVPLGRRGVTGGSPKLLGK